MSPEAPPPPAGEPRTVVEPARGPEEPKTRNSSAHDEAPREEGSEPERDGRSEAGEPLFDTKIGTNFGSINFQTLSSAPVRREAQFDIWNTKRLGQLWEDLVLPADEVERIVARLRGGRFLIVTGPKQLGKTSMVLLAAAWMLRNPDSRTCEVALLCRGLQATTRLDIEAVTGRKSEFRERLIIIDRAFAQSNEDLVHFLADLDDLRLDSLDERLRKAKSFLVLIDDETTSGTESQLEKLQRLRLVERLQAPDPEDLSRGLSSLAQRLLRSVSEEESHRLVSLCLREHGELLVARLKTLPRLAWFVREYLLAVAVGTLSVDQALARIETPESWFLEELPQDQEAWCAVVALTLCSAAPPEYETSWLQFDLIRRNVLGRVFWETRQRKPTSDASHLCATQGLLGRTRAEVVNHRIRFLEPRLAQEIWKVLLERGRDLLAVLVPMLRELVRNEDFSQQQIAAWALGRIGQIDAPHLIWPLVERWATASKARRGTSAFYGSLLGSLFQGALGAEEDRDYRAECLAILDRLLADSDDETCATALISLTHVAIVDWDLAVPRLLRVAKRRLSLDWPAVRELQTIYLAHEIRLRKRAPSAKAIRALRELPEIAELRFIAELLSTEKFSVCNAFAYVIGELMELNPFRALSTLRAWAAADRRQVGPLIALLSFHRSGVLPLQAGLQEAEAFEVEEFTQARSLLARAVADEALLFELGEFLIEMFGSFSCFPGVLRRTLEESFDKLLAAWAATSVAAQSTLPSVAATVCSLLLRFFSAENRDLSERTFGYTSHEGPEGEMVALRVLTLQAFTNGH